ncbi:MAG: dihydrofolate reductase, partial [Verrucomicrobia bacterium]|nr:dihydrofolate reductase [Verrucomicrobiota bacterium]
MSNVILYIATSQDGFIADEQGGVDWLPSEPD